MKPDVPLIMTAHSRLRAVLATCAYLVAALPIWYFLTAVPRPDIPHVQMQSTMSHAKKLNAPHGNLVIYFLPNKGTDRCI